MLVKFTVEGGCEPVFAQARPDVLESTLRILRSYDSNAEGQMRDQIKSYLDSNTTFTAKQIASTGVGEDWKPEFENLYNALFAEYKDGDVAFAEAGKCLGLLVWSEALDHEEKWHFTQYPKDDAEYLVTHYFSVDGHIRYKAKLAQAETALAHGDFLRAEKLQEAAMKLKDKWS